MTDVSFRAPITLLFLGLFIHCNLAPRYREDTSNYYLSSTSEFPIKLQSISSPGFEVFLTSQRCQRRAAIFFQKPQSCFLLNLMLLCGDINVNPGPVWKFPCGLCKKPVKCNQPGIQCDSCDSWLHVRCLEMNIDDYETLAISSCTWICPDCDVSNFATTLLDFK